MSYLICNIIDKSGNKDMGDDMAKFTAFKLELSLETLNVFYINQNTNLKYEATHVLLSLHM